MVSPKDLKPLSNVRLRIKNNILEGRILESADPEVILLKLNNGYNIGLDPKEIEDIEILKENKTNILKNTEPKEKQNKSLKKVVILSTGGTIASKIDYKTGGVVASYSPDDLLKAVPEISKIANIETKEIFEEMSENFTYENWKKIAEEVFKELKRKDVHGVIIAHGTDTMHYTSSALSFFLKDLNKPIAITGSQRSSDRPSSDTFMNLICAVHYALSDCAEVSIVMHGSISDDYCFAIRGTKSRKMHTSRRDAFKAINDTPLLKIHPSGKIEALNKYNKRNEKEPKLNTKFNENICLIKFFPGMKKDILEFLLEKHDGAVIEGTGMGHVKINGKQNLFPVIENALKKGKTIVMTSQTIYGRVHPYVYKNLRLLSNAGVIYAEDMTPETAYIKLGWVLAQTNDKEKIKELFLRNISGEINERLKVDEFLD